MKQTTSFYSAISQDIEDGGYNKDKIAFILNSIGSGVTILDIGCNDGSIGSLLRKKKNIVYGLDIAEHKVKAARKKGIKATTCDIESKRLPYHNDFFDVVLLTDVIEHVFDTDRVLEDIYRVLKKGGMLLITTPNVASLLRRCMLVCGINPCLEYSARYMGSSLSPVGHIRYYTHADLRHQLQTCGFHHIMAKGDRVNFHLFSNPFAANICPSLSVNIFCTCNK